MSRVTDAACVAQALVLEMGNVGGIKDVQGASPWALLVGTSVDYSLLFCAPFGRSRLVGLARLSAHFVLWTILVPSPQLEVVHCVPGPLSNTPDSLLDPQSTHTRTNTFGVLTSLMTARASVGTSSS